MNRLTEAFAALVCILIGLAGFFSISTIAFGIANDMKTVSATKSDKELCEERGGVYVVMRSGPNRCFSKEAFK